MDDPGTTFEFDIALSFAGENRAYVADVAERLRSQDIRVFYDQYEQATLWGKNLYDRLDYVYRRAARYCILFISKQYADKVWTNHERQSAQARALDENQEYVLPVRFDDTEISGLHSTVAYIDARHTTPDQLVQLILQKLGDSPNPLTAPTPVRIPQTPEQQRQLLEERPPFWEYWLLAGILAQGKDALEPKWRDHQLRYARVTGQPLDDSQVGPFIVAAMNEPQAFVQNAERVLNRQVMELALGPPGVSGDPVRIEHVGHRVIAIYEDFLDWSARLRGTVTSPQYRRLLDLAASIADMPATQIRQFIDQYVATAGRLPELLAEAGDEPVELKLVLEFDIDKRIITEYNKEFRRLRRRGAFELAPNGLHPGPSAGGPPLTAALGQYAGNTMRVHDQ